MGVIIEDEVNKYVTKPISLGEVADLLGEASDVGAVCASDNINMWAKYTPVCLTDKFTPDDVVDGFWSEKEYAATGKPWYYGADGSEKFDVPRLDSPADITGGKQWSMNKPDGSVYPFRLADFLGYNHLAKCPLAAFVPSRINVNTDNICGIGVIDNTGRFSFTAQEVFDLFPAKEVYLGLVLRAPGWDGSTYHVLSKEMPIDMSDSSTCQFNVRCDKEADNSYWLTVVNDDGSALSTNAEIGDDIEIMLFLTDTPSMTSFDVSSEIKFSAKFDDSSSVYSLTSLSYVQLTYSATLSESQPIYTDYDNLDTDKFVNLAIGGQTIIARVSSYITGFSEGGVTVKADNTNSISFSSMYVRMYQRLSLTVDGEDYTSEEWMYPLNLVERQSGSISATGTEYTLPASVEDTFEVYDTEDDAITQNNPTTIQGYPLIDEIISNSAYPDKVGWCSMELAIRAVATANTEYTNININGEILP